MFFLIRSAVCIGLVTAALPARPSADGRLLDDLAPQAATAARTTLIQFCGSHQDHCLLPLQAAAAAPLEAGSVAPRRLVSFPAAAPAGHHPMDRRWSAATVQHGA